MSKKVLLDLAMKLSADNAELKRGLNDTKKEFKKFNNNSKNVGKDIANHFAKIGIAIAGVKKGFDLMKSTIRSVQSTGDKMEQTIGGLNEGFTYLQQSLMTLDFNDLIDGFIRANEVGREYIRMLDEIADRDRAIGIRESKLRMELSELDLIIRGNTTTELEKQEAIEKRRLLLNNHLNQSIKTRQMDLDNELNRLRELYNLDDDGVKAMRDYVEYYDVIMDSGGFDRINEIWEQEKALKDLGLEIANLSQGGQYLSGDALVNRTNLIKSKDAEMRALKETIQNNKNALGEIERAWVTAHEKLTDKVRDNLGRVISSYYDAQTRINQELRKTERYERSTGGTSGGTSDGTEVDVVIPEGSIADLRNKVSEYSKQLEMSVDIGERRALKNIIEYYEDQIDYLLNREGQLIDITPFIKEEQEILETLPIHFGETNYELINGLSELNNKLVETQTNFRALQNIAIGSLQGIAISFVDMAFGAEQSIEDIMKNMMKMIMVQLISLGIQQLLMGIFTGGASVVGMGAALSAMKTSPIAGGFGIPSFADGGLLYGESLIRAGEYGGVKSNPEVIAPLNKLENILSSSGVGGVNGNVRFIIEDNVLVGLLEKHGKKQIIY